MSTLNWRAIGIAVVSALVCGFLTTALLRVLVKSGVLSLHEPSIVVYLWSSSATVDIITGAMAGGIARTRGALHGLIAGIIASIASPLVSIAMLLARGQPVKGSYWVAHADSVAWSSLPGIAIAAIAGAIAAAIIRRRQATI